MEWADLQWKFFNILLKYIIHPNNDYLFVGLLKECLYVRLIELHLGWFGRHWSDSTTSLVTQYQCNLGVNCCKISLNA